MKIPFSPPDIGEKEIENVISVLKSGWITTGPKTKELENEVAKYCGTEKAVCLNSATACLELTLRLLGIGKGDEVITCAYTYTASASVIEHVGAKIVLVDTKRDSYEMDLESLSKGITSKTKAIIPVDLAGVMCSYDEIYEVINSKRNIFKANNAMQEAIGRVAIVADAAHSFGAKYKGAMSGRVADFTSFSFHAVKNLTTAEGGAVTWKNIKGISNEEIYKRFMILSLHGQTKDALAKTTLGSWEYDIVEPAYKCNMTDIMAAIGLAQLERYESMLDYRKELINIYNNNLDEKYLDILNHYDDRQESSGHLFLVRVKGASLERRNEIIQLMAQEGIATNVHYKPLPLLTAYKNMGFEMKDYPNAYDMFENEITLPLNTMMSKEDVLYICEKLNNIIKD